jgi:hypothetical protein
MSLSVYGGLGMKCEFELDELMRAFIGVRVDNVLAILNALGVDLNSEEYLSQFQGAPPLEQASSSPVLKHTTPALCAGQSSELHPETVFGQDQSHLTSPVPPRTASLSQGKE